MNEENGVKVCVEADCAEVAGVADVVESAGVAGQVDVSEEVAEAAEAGVEEMQTKSKQNVTIAADSEADSEEAGAEAAGDSEALATMLAEAEARGYLRGRNEVLEEVMRRPGVYEREKQRSGESGLSRCSILENVRGSVWD